MLWLLLYIATIPAANYVVQHYGIVVVALGPWVFHAPAAVYLVGLAFTFRDLAQNRLGRWPIVAGILVGAALSFAIAPAFAVASGVAFLVSESADFAVYTPLEERGRWLLGVGLSNSVGLVFDSVLFLWLAFGSLAFLPGQILGKALMTALALAILAPLRRRREVRPRAVFLEPEAAAAAP